LIASAKFRKETCRNLAIGAAFRLLIETHRIALSRAGTGINPARTDAAASSRFAARINGAIQSSYRAEGRDYTYTDVCYSNRISNITDTFAIGIAVQPSSWIKARRQDILQLNLMSARLVFQQQAGQIVSAE
jgi:hypothetical protein